MQKKIRIAIDMDEVVVDLFSEMFAVEGFDIAQQTSWELSGEVLEAFVEKYCTYKYYSTRPPMRGAIYGVYELAGIGYEIIFVTATPAAKKSQNLLEAKKFWLRKHFPDLEYSFISTDAKHLVDADIIIDDKVSTCKYWNSLGRPAILFIRPWNSTEDVGEAGLNAPLYRTTWDITDGSMPGGMLSCITNAVLWMEMVKDYEENKLLHKNDEKKEEKLKAKSAIDLLPAWAQLEMGLVMGNGRALGYKPMSWLLSEKHTSEKHLSCALRHINSIQRGEVINHADGGTHHFSNAAVRLMMYYERKMYEDGVHPQQAYLEELASKMESELATEVKVSL